MAKDWEFVRMCCGAMFTLVVGASQLPAQSAHPFGEPVTSPVFSLMPVAGMVDVNRDGTRDLVVPGLFFGSLMSTLDENGRSLGANASGPNMSIPAGVSMLPNMRALVGGRFDGDKLHDLVSVTNNGTMHFHRNLGSTQLDQSNWAPDVIFDDVRAAYPINPPFVTYSFPVAKVLDFDGDGNQDVLIAGGPIDRWSGLTKPGFVCIYKGDGQGGFQALRYGLSGSVIDAEIADLDNDGEDEGVVVLTETGAVGVFAYELLHLNFTAGGLVPVGLSQSIGPGRLTALELGDVVGDSNDDYIVSYINASPGSVAADVYYYQGNGQGVVNTSVWGTLSLPIGLTGVGDHISSIQVEDFDCDGYDDVAVLRGFVQPHNGTAASTAIYYPSEVVFAMGPSAGSAATESVALPGATIFADTSVFSLTPMTPHPDQLQVTSFGGTSGLDLMVLGMRIGSAYNQPSIASLKNQTLPELGDARQIKIGEPTGAVASRPARIGFDGGRPAPGNGDFACTIQNVQGGCVVGLVWNQIAIENLFTIRGFTMHLGPQLYGSYGLASGDQFRDGFYSQSLPIPNNPALIGELGCFQYVYYDHVVGAFGGTQATCVWIGS